MIKAFEVIPVLSGKSRNPTSHGPFWEALFDPTDVGASTDHKSRVV